METSREQRDPQGAPGRWGGAAAGLLAVLVVVLGQGLMLRHGGVSEYHGEVALVASMDAGALADFQCPGCPERTVLGRPGLQILEVGDTGKLLLERGERRRWLGYVPFMVVFLPWTVDLWASAPALLGGGLGALKAFALANLVLFALVFWGFARQWLGPRVAALACVLLAVDPFVAVVLRVAPMPLRLPAYACAALLALELGRRSPRWLGAGGFLLGMGLCNSLMFAWCGVGVLVWLAIGGDLRAWGRAGWARVAGGFGVGVLPLLVYNALSDGATWRFVTRNAGGTEAGVAPLSLGNVVARLGQALGMVEPAGLLAGYTGWSMPATGHGLLALGAVGALLWGLRAADGGGRREIGALLALPPAILLASPFTLSSLGPHHMALGLPFVLLIVATAIARLPRRGAGVALALWLLGSLLFARSWTATMQETGGVRIWSDVSLELTAALQELGGRPVAVQPQPYYNPLFLSDGAVVVRNPYGWDVNTGGADVGRAALLAALEDPATVFVRKLLPDGGTPRSALGDDPHWDAFVALAAEQGRRLTVVRSVREGDVELGYDLLRVVP